MSTPAEIAQKFHAARGRNLPPVAIDTSRRSSFSGLSSARAPRRTSGARTCRIARRPSALPTAARSSARPPAVCGVSSFLAAYGAVAAYLQAG